MCVCVYVEPPCNADAHRRVNKYTIDAGGAQCTVLHNPVHDDVMTVWL